MKSILSILLLSFFCCSSTFANFSSITGNLKFKCITEDESFITTIEIKFNKTKNPETLVSINAGSWIKNSAKAILIQGPPETEQFEIVYENEISKNFISVYKIIFDNTFLIGDIYNGTKFNKSDPFKSTLESQIKCVKLGDTTVLVKSKNEVNTNSNKIDQTKTGSILKSILKSIN